MIIAQCPLMRACIANISVLTFLYSLELCADKKKNDNFLLIENLAIYQSNWTDK